MPDRKVIGLATGLALIITLATPALAQTGATPPAPMVLVSDAEIQALEAVLMAEVEKNRVRKCLRPVFSGKPTSGPADEKIRGIIEGELHRGCYQAVEENADAVSAYLEAPVAPDSKAPAAVVSACISLPGAIRSAIQHADACSPYIFGRNGLPELLPVVRGGRALAVLIRHEGTAGNWKGAIDMTLNGVRFYQDFGRGPGSSLIVAMVATAAIGAIVDLGLSPLLERSVPPPAEFKMVLRGLSALLATEPPYCDCMGYERYGVPLQFLLPGMKGEGWVPPGGFDHGSMPPVDFPATKRFGLAPGQEMALAWVAMETVHARFAEMCQTNHTTADLFKAMRAASEEIIAKPRQSSWKRALLLFFARDPQRALRDWVTDILQAVAIPSFDKYVIRYAQRRFKLQGLRLQLLVSRYSIANGTCPSLKGLEHHNFAQATVDPGSGKPMVISFPKNGTLKLTPAQETVDAVNDAERVGSYVFTCPTK